MNPDPTRSNVQLTEEQAAEIGSEVHIYGYPLVTMEMTRASRPIQPSPLACVGRWGNSSMPASFRL